MKHSSSHYTQKTYVMKKATVRTEDEINHETKQMLLKGLSQRFIAVSLGVSLTTVSRVAQDNHLTKKTLKDVVRKMAVVTPPSSRSKKLKKDFIPKYKDKGFAGLLKPSKGKRTLPHEDQCKNILSSQKGDHWCQNKRAKHIGNGHYCEECRKKLYVKGKKGTL